jgi:hypothetical protein
MTTIHKYTIEDFDPHKWENQIEHDIIEDADAKHDSVAVEWTNPLNGLFAGDLSETSNRLPSERVNSNSSFERHWNDKIRQQRKSRGK